MWGRQIAEVDLQSNPKHIDKFIPKYFILTEILQWKHERALPKPLQKEWTKLLPKQCESLVKLYWRKVAAESGCASCWIMEWTWGLNTASIFNFTESIVTCCDLSWTIDRLSLYLVNIRSTRSFFIILAKLKKYTFKYLVLKISKIQTKQNI